ncbi:class I SAM-dependent methyltransferase [Mesorhizobium sp. WSM4884]|uniref:class I SAM-dependent methyltransferase n=1 Tax=Mesorhizobium sp. WSM4884 TaxID=3038542 RepID=UPI002417868F|nr:class I SAM-dependent methyltransferase [Mesorhizobium sp. WSM4884]MDG4882748.1 class I SAM-dependent methyltransferase [Mesorhizobium sp. WSM4884]
MDDTKGLEPERVTMTVAEQERTVRRVLENCMASDISAEVAIARLALYLRTGIEAAELADIALDMRSSALCRRGWLEEVAVLLSRKGDVFDSLRLTAASVSHDRSDDETREMTVSRLASGFDQAAVISPAASVQLSSLGDEERLSAATAEIASWLEQRGFLGTGKAILDIGCGIGRFECALHTRAKHIVGIDISSKMLAIARRRCAGLVNVKFRRTSGLDLGEFAAGRFDGVLAVDSFPYLMLAGVAERHFSEMARVLRPGGMAIILNYSYRMSSALDSSDIRRLAHTCVMDVIVDGEKPFRRWDGTAFLVRRSGGT